MNRVCVLCNDVQYQPKLSVQTGLKVSLGLGVSNWIGAVLICKPGSSPVRSGLSLVRFMCMWLMRNNSCNKINLLSC